MHIIMLVHYFSLNCASLDDTIFITNSSLLPTIETSVENTHKTGLMKIIWI